MYFFKGGLMKITRAILLSLIIILFQSNVFLKSYHIICVSIPLETIENNFIKQKLFIRLFKKLIKERNKITSRQNIITFGSLNDKNFTKYNTEKLNDVLNPHLDEINELASIYYK